MREIAIQPLLLLSFMTAGVLIYAFDSNICHADQEIQQSLVDMGFMTNVLRSKTPLVQDEPDAIG